MAAPRPTGVGPRTATADEWATSSVILAVGEEGIAWDTGVTKYGDGTNRWADLPTPVGGTVDLTPVLARVDEVEDTAEHADTAAANARAMTLARDARLLAIEAALASTAPPVGDPDLPDLTVVFENGLV